MHLNSKSSSTIVANKPWLVRCLILSITGPKATFSLGVSSHALFLAVGALIGRTRRSWTSAHTTTQSSL
jgi:hypothetical protein